MSKVQLGSVGFARLVVIVAAICCCLEGCAANESDDDARAEYGTKACALDADCGKSARCIKADSGNAARGICYAQCSIDDASTCDAFERTECTHIIWAHDSTLSVCLPL